MITRKVEKEGHIPDTRLECNFQKGQESMSRDRNLKRILFKYGADVVRQSSTYDVEKGSTFVITTSVVKKCPDQTR